MSNAIMLITSVSGTVGLSIMFRLDLRRIPTAALGGLISCGVYLIFMAMGTGLFTSSLAGAAAVSLYSEICARILRAPVTVFLTPSLIPLMPGSYLYYTMYSVFRKDFPAFAQNAVYTAVVGFGVAVGVISVAAVTKIILSKLHNRKKYAE
ncbi:MAG: threonine/serine exporter family protein [Clostridiales bacterium]|nr:threonine/serine exporter family protein [Clostridiales bacterium]